MMNKKILSFVIVACMLWCAVYAYPASVNPDGMDSVQVYGGAAYVLSFTVNNSSEEVAEVNVLDENSNIIGGAKAKTTDGTVTAYSMPLIMPAATDMSGKVTVSIEKTIPSGAEINNIKLNFASGDIINLVQQEEVLTLRGNIGGTSRGRLEIYVLCDAEEYEYSNPEKVLQYQALEKNKNSTYSLTVDTSEINRYYTDMTMLVKGLESFGYEFDGVALDFRYTKTTLKEELVGELKDVETKADLIDILEGGDETLSNYELLGISEIGIASEYSEKAFLYDYLYKNKSEITLEKLNTLVIEGCMIEAMTNNEVTDSELAAYIDEYAETLGLTDEKFTPYGEVYSNMTDNDKETAVNKMRKEGTAIDSVEKIRISLANAALKTEMNNAQNYTGVIAILKDNAEYLDLDIPTNLSTKSQKALASYAKEAKDVLTISDELEKIIDAEDDTESGGSGSGGSGSGRGGGSSSIGVVPYVKAPEATDEKVDTEQKAERFSDLNDAAWAVEYINSMAEKGILNGYKDGTFCPNKSITRAEFAKIIATAFELYDENAESEFSDVPKDDWSYKYISSLFSLGIINGVGNGEFGKDENISRQDMAVILSRVIREEQLEAKGEELNFTDSDEISEYAKEAVALLKALGVVSGMEDGSFKPNGNTTRAEAAKVVCAAMDIVK